MGRRISEQLQETSGAGALSSRKKNQKNLEVGGGGGFHLPLYVGRLRFTIYLTFHTSSNVSTHFQMKLASSETYIFSHATPLAFSKSTYLLDLYYSANRRFKGY